MDDSICRQDINDNSFVSLNEVQALLLSVLSRISLENSSKHDVTSLHQHVSHSHSSTLSPPSLSPPSSSPSRSSSSYGACFPPFKPVNDASVSRTKYKTELCRAFEEQKQCRYGSKCQFAHGVSELRTLNRHAKYKTDLCYAFHMTGFCSYGTRCHFIHSEEERRQHSTTQRSPVPTSEYQQFSQQRLKSPGDDSLDGLGRSSQTNDDELAHRELLPQIARVMSPPNGRQAELRLSRWQQLNTSVEQRLIDGQRFDRSADIWTHCSSPSTSMFNLRGSRSSPVAFETGLSSVAEVGESYSEMDSFINDVVFHPFPPFPPLATSTLISGSRSLSCDELITVALVKQALRSHDVELQDIVDFVQSCNIKSGAFNLAHY